MAAVRVLIVEFDESLRGVLHDALRTAAHDYAVTEVATETEALAVLARQPPSVGMVVVCSNREADHQHCTAFFASVVADKRLAARHQYLLLSTNPAHISDTLHMHLAVLHAPILSKPFELDALLALVEAAAARRATTQPVARLRRQI